MYRIYHLALLHNRRISFEKINRESNMSDAQLKHLEFVQNVVTRMNSNSFQIKNWSITVFTSFICTLWKQH